MIVIKVILALVLLSIAYQDIKERLVSWILFPILGGLMGGIYFNLVSIDQYYPFVLINYILVSSILLILFIYTTFIRGIGFINKSIGLGDILFLYAFALGFPTITFLILLVSACLFSLIIYFFQTEKEKHLTIPLAGFMSLFLLGAYSLSHLMGSPYLYKF